MAKLEDTDQFLVNRINTYQLEAQNLMAELLDDDLMLVNREGVTFTATGQEIKDSLDNAVPVLIETVVLTEDEPGVKARYTDKEFTAAVNCEIKSAEPIVYGLKAKSEGSLVKQAQTSVITGFGSITGSDTPAGGIQGTLTYGAPSLAQSTSSTPDAWINGAFQNTTVVGFKGVTGVASIRIYAVARGGSCRIGLNSRSMVTIPNIGGQGSSNSPTVASDFAWYDLSDSMAIPSTLLNLSCVGSGVNWDNAIQIWKIEVNGVQLTNDDNARLASPSYQEDVLTLTDPTGLDEFTPGEDIVQNGGGTPVSSAITNVANTNFIGDVSISTGGYLSGRGPENVFDGDTNTACEGDTVGSVLTFNITANVDQSLGGVEIFAADTPAEPITVELKNSGVVVDTFTGGVENGAWHSSNYTGPIDQILVSRPGRAAEFAAYKINGTRVQEGPILTLTDDTNLANFRVGDVVQGASGQIYSSGFTCPQGFLDENRDAAKAFDGIFSGNNSAVCFNAGGAQSFDFVFSPSVSATKLEICFEPVTGQTISVNGGTAVTATGLGENNFVDFSSLITSGQVSSVTLSTPNAGVSERLNVYGFKVNDLALVDPVGPFIKVTAIDEATPSITVDGGSWIGTDGSGEGPTTWNQDQIWSDTITTTGSGFEYPETNLFNGFYGPGVTNTQAMCSSSTNGETISVTFADIDVTSTVEVWAQKANVYSQVFCTVNGVETIVPTTEEKWHVVNGGNVGALTLMRSNSTNNAGQAGRCDWAAIRVDGKLLVDPRDISQVWSDSVTSTNGYESGSTPDKLFDGIATTGQDNRCESKPPGLITFVSPVVQSGALSLFVTRGDGDASPSGNYDIKLDGVSIFDNSILPFNTSAWVDFGDKTWTTLTFGSTTGGNWIGISAIKVADTFLIDKGVYTEADTSVTGPTFAAAEGKVSSVDVAATPPTLTVSGSTGRWLVTEADYQEDLKLNKKAQSKNFVEVDNAELFAIFDAEGNISDMSGTDPGYRDMVSTGTVFETFNLKFPSLFSNGKTPDETLPSGATLCVDVKATNISGEDTKLDTCVTPEDPDPEPQADMHGLRFDSARETYLNFSSPASPVKTFSVWVKPTSTADCYILGGNGSIFFGITGNKFSIDGTAYPSAPTLETNKWVNAVVAYNGTDSTLYVNGVDCGSSTIDSSSWTNRYIGTNSGRYNIFNGYLSECYFVDGQALPPETFGYDYENQGKWAPLDKAVIKQNIEDAKALDGPGYDDSQVWSNGAITQTNGTWQTIFDGDGAGYIGGAINGKSDWEAPGGQNTIPINSELKCKGANSLGQIVINGIIGSDVPGATLSDGYANFGSHFSFLDSISVGNRYAGFNDTGNYFDLQAVYIDGSLLVDPRNTSQMWSKGVSAPNGTLYNNEVLSFTGSTSTWTSTLDSNNIVFAPAQPVEINTSFGYYAPDSPYTTAIRLTLDGASKDLDVSTALGLVTISEFVGKTISITTPLTVETLASTRTECNFGEIAIDGELLVDGGFGENGFYLPFDPAATGGVNHVSNLTIDTGSILTPANGFDGNVTSSSYAESSVFGAKIRYTFFAPVSGLITVWSAGDATNPTTITVSTGQSTTVNTQGYPPTQISALTNVQWVELERPGGTTAFTGIAVNGEVLIDYNSIGVDDSGNGNNFHDQNFAVGNASEVWSAYCVAPSGLDTAGHPNTKLSSAFNGEIALDSGETVPAVGDTVTFTPPEAISGNVRISLRMAGSSGQSAGSIVVNGNDYSTPAQAIWAGVNIFYWVETSETELTSVVWKRTNSGDFAHVAAIEVAGKTLIDANIQDTVTDTPLKNYATLLTGSNGNLVATGDSSTSYLGEVGTDYYYEEDGVGKVHTGGATFSSTDGKTYNFGQQPFVTAGYDDSQVWSTTVANSGAWRTDVNSKANLFNGDSEAGYSYAGNDNGDSVNNPAILTFTGITGSLIQVTSTGDGNQTVQLNSETPVTLPRLGTYTIYSGPSVAINTIKFTSKNPTGATVRQIIVDGTVLVDPGSPIVAAYANTLFQKWSEWNNVSLMLATNPAHVARFNTMKAAMDAFPAERTAYRRSLLTSIVASGLSTQQKVYLLTEGSDGNVLESGPFARDGYFPLYDTEEVSDDVSTNGESHSHTFDGITYYMPDEGTTLYHGNY